MVPQPFRLVRTWRETRETFTLEIEPADRVQDLTFAPGQFNMLYVFGKGEVPISISGNPAKPGTYVHTTRMVGAVTKGMGQLGPGDFIGVRGPFGRPWPLKEATGHDVVLVAGGIGLAPLRPALYYILARRSEYGRVVLLYGARTPDDLLYQRELQRWRARFDLDVYVTVDRVTGDWRGHLGVVTLLIPRAPFDPARTAAFICGPEVMMRFTVQELLQKGVPPAKIFVSLERNMKCGMGICGRCQLGPFLVCRDGPVFSFDQIAPLFGKSEV